MYRCFCFLLLCGCVTTHDPQPSDTELKHESRDWLLVFRYELKIAIENEDKESYYYFMQEIIKERVKRETGQDMDPNPSLIFEK